MSKCGGTGLMSYQTFIRYRHTGIDVVPIPVPSPVQTSLPVPGVPVLMPYRTHRSVRYRSWCTEVTQVSGTGIDVPNLPKCPVPVIPAVYRTHPLIFLYFFCQNVPGININSTQKYIGPHHEHVIFIFYLEVLYSEYIFLFFVRLRSRSYPLFQMYPRAAVVRMLCLSYPVPWHDMALRCLLRLLRYDLPLWPII